MIIHKRFRSLGLKGLSLGLAVLLWMSVSNQPVVERGLYIPLDLQDVPHNIEISGDLPGSVHVRMRGPRYLIRTLDSNNVQAYVSLAGLPPGSYNRPVKIESTDEFGVMYIEPPIVRVTLR